MCLCYRRACWPFLCVLHVAAVTLPFAASQRFSFTLRASLPQVSTHAQQGRGACQEHSTATAQARSTHARRTWPHCSLSLSAHCALCAAPLRRIPFFGPAAPRLRLLREQRHRHTPRGHIVLSTLLLSPPIMLSLRSALLVALAALCCGSSLVSAQGPPYNFTLTTSSGQVPGALPAFRVFAGATEYITVQHSAPLGVGEGTNIVLTCTTAGPSDVGVTVYPASHCLTSDGSSPVSRMFAVTAGSKNVGDASNTVTCTFALQGINTAVFGVVPALGPIIIRAPQKLTMPASIAGALDSANPMEVYAFADYGTLYDFTFLAGAEEAAVGSVWLTPTCVSTAMRSSRFTVCLCVWFFLTPFLCLLCVGSRVWWSSLVPLRWMPISTSTSLCNSVSAHPRSATRDAHSVSLLTTTWTMEGSPCQPRSTSRSSDR